MKIKYPQCKYVKDFLRLANISMPGEESSFRAFSGFNLDDELDFLYLVLPKTPSMVDQEFLKTIAKKYELTDADAARMCHLLRTIVGTTENTTPVSIAPYSTTYELPPPQFKLSTSAAEEEEENTRPCEEEEENTHPCEEEVPII
jgi:hypothetical protein